jgi:FKBP-type peptidyl-prolyl cis-trans isomerase
MKANAPDLDAKALAQGITDAFAGLEPKLTEEQVTAAMQAFQAAMEAKAAERNAKNKRDGEAYLVANKKKEGVVTLPSGLQYKVIKKGNGAKPKATDTVRTHYHGTLISGEVFDSSVERGEPATFAVGGVIRGWTEALQLMPVGSKWRLFVPAALAYGPQARGAAIGPNSTLIFEIELLAIE